MTVLLFLKVALCIGILSNFNTLTYFFRVQQSVLQLESLFMKINILPVQHFCVRVSH